MFIISFLTDWNSKFSTKVLPICLSSAGIPSYMHTHTNRRKKKKKTNVFSLTPKRNRRLWLRIFGTSNLSRTPFPLCPYFPTLLNSLTIEKKKTQPFLAPIMKLSWGKWGFLWLSSPDCSHTSATKTSFEVAMIHKEGKKTFKVESPLHMSVQIHNKTSSTFKQSPPSPNCLLSSEVFPKSFPQKGESSLLSNTYCKFAIHKKFYCLI